PLLLHIVNPFVRSASSFSDKFHNVKGERRIESLLHQINHNIITETNNVRQLTNSVVDQFLRITKPYIRTMGKPGDNNEFFKCFWLRILKHLSDKACTEFRNT